jgi:hypothetical protein
MITFSQVDVAVYYELRLPSLRQRGKRWRGPCPIHSGKHESFSVDPESGRWRCWSSCGRGGDIIALEMELTGAVWRTAVAEVEQMTGRVLLDRPANSAERQSLAERRTLELREIRDAESFRIAALAMAEQILDELPDAVPERFGSTQLLLSLRRSGDPALLAVYREFRARDRRLAAALVHAGQSAWRRRCDALARFINALAEAENAA